MSATAKLLDFAHRPHVLSVTVRADALRLLGDALAVGAAGAPSFEAAKVRKAIARWGNSEDCRLLGGGRASAPDAAWFNGFSIHCLEWDPVHEPAVVHALSVVTAALLAVADRQGGCDGDAFLTALAVGVDIASGMGLAAQEGLRFFRPATAGIIGAALAAARLEGFAREQFDDVLGLAYSQAAGTMQAHVEASIALPLQIAAAARGAISAIDCVAVGLNGPHHALEGPFGYFTLFEKGDVAQYAAGLGDVWRISEVSIKPFPSGRASHGALGCLVEARINDEFHVDSVQRIEAHVPPLIHRLVGRPAKPDMTAAYARLCLPFLVALMLRDGVVDPRRFVPDQFADPGLAAMAAKVHVTLDSNSDPNALSPQRLVVETANGRREYAIAGNLGSPALPMSQAQAAQKYDLARQLAGRDGDKRLFDDPLTYAIQGTDA